MTYDLTIPGHKYQAYGMGSYVGAPDLRLGPMPHDYSQPMVLVRIGDTETTVRLEQLVRIVHAAAALWGPLGMVSVQRLPER